MTMQPGKYDFTIYQGATLEELWTWKDESGVAVNLTGYTARLKAKPSKTHSNTVLSLTNADGITLGGTAGTIAISRSAAQTAALAVGNLVYDLELISAGGVVIRLMEGAITVDGEVTT